MNQAESQKPVSYMQVLIIVRAIYLNSRSEGQFIVINIVSTWRAELLSQAGWYGMARVVG